MLPPEEMFSLKTRKYLHQNNKASIILETKDVKHIEKKLKKLKRKGVEFEHKYICPICGSILNINSFPMYFGDDYYANCPVCCNRFQFGGTYPIDYNFVYLKELPINSIEQVSYSMITLIRDKTITSGGISLYSDRIGVIAQKDRFGFFQKLKVIGIVWI